MVYHPLKKINDMNSWCVIIFHFIATTYRDKPINTKAMHFWTNVWWLGIKKSNVNVFRRKCLGNGRVLKDWKKFWINCVEIVLRQRIYFILGHTPKQKHSFCRHKIYNRKLLPFCLAIYVCVWVFMLVCIIKFNWKVFHSIILEILWVQLL